jgi:hypothetical protein
MRRDSLNSGVFFFSTLISPKGQGSICCYEVNPALPSAASMVQKYENIIRDDDYIAHHGTSVIGQKCACGIQRSMALKCV